MFPRGDGQKAVWSEWHEKREKARTTAFSLSEFSPQEQTDYDLTAEDVTGKFVDESYLWDRPLWPTRRHDVRDDPCK